MNIIVKILFLLGGILLPGLTICQSSISISGKVLDENNKGVDLALVSLQTVSDSTFVKAEYSDTDGSFTLSSISEGAYFIQVHLLGYQEYTEAIEVKPGSEDDLFSEIILTTSDLVLDQVTIVGKTPFIERKIDRTVVNVDALIANDGSDILSVMERAPGISLDNEGGILLKGRGGVAVYIDDKPTNLSGAELDSYLRSLPSGTVKSIEIMTNPPAKYEAAGNSGIINIVLKKNTLQGYNGNVSVALRQGKYSNNNNSLNLNYNDKKWSVYTQTSGGFWNFYQDLNINRYYRNELNERLSSFSQNSYGFRGGEYFNNKIGVDYDLLESTIIGVSYRFNSNPYERQNDNVAVVSDSDDSLIQNVIADNNTQATFRSNVYNAYINHKLDTLGSSISMDMDYASYNSGSDQLFKNYIYDPQALLVFEDQVNGAIPSSIDIYGGRIDYFKVLVDGSKIEGGVKSAFTKTDNEAIYSTTIEQVTIPNYQLSNRFLYEEWINAGYVNYTQSLGPVGIQLGLRGEHTHLNGNQLGNIETKDTTFTRTYISVFPTLYARWKMDEKENNVLSFSYGRRIDRPYFQDLNPFISPLDKFTFYSGNPNLLPTYSHNLSLAYSYKNLLTATLSYSQTVDAINETLEIQDEIYYSRPGNIDDSRNFSLSLEASVPITSWYNFNTYLELSHVRYVSELYTEKLDSEGTFYYLSGTNSFNFGKGWGADLTGSYRSDMVYSQLLLKSYGQINIGFKKNIFDNKGSLKLSVDDLFYTRRGDGVINNLHLTDADWNSKYDSRRVTLAFSMRFGKSTNQKAKYKVNGSQDEQNRVKS